jgi:hypothetical protein
MRTRILHKLILGALLAFLAPLLCAQDGADGALSRANLVTADGGAFAIADFDGDNKPDGAVVVDAGLLRNQRLLRIELHFTGRVNSSFAFESSASNHTVAAWDVDNDNDIDIVVARGPSRRGLGIWLNDGKGGFHQGRTEDFPSAAAPCSERLRSPGGRTENPVVSLPQERGSETAVITPRYASGSPATTGELQNLPRTHSPASREFAQNPSRAPPVHYSL